jgi:4-amino-4-deoxy-L-arabinose transferase-like glycosyltransferase
MPHRFSMRGAPGFLAELLCLLLLYIWMAAFSYAFFFDSLTGNIREIATYSSDSFTILDLVNHSLSSRPFQMDFFAYGHFYFNVAVALSYIYSLFFPLDEWTTFLILRAISWIGTALTVALVFAFARRFLGRIESVFAACLIAFSPAAIEWGIEVHPDTWQMFFLTLSLYFCARAVAVPPAAMANATVGGREPANFVLVLAAGAAAGAAFGTKYLGIILFPLLVAAVLMTPIEPRTDRHFALATRWIVLLAAVLAAVIAVVGHETTGPLLVATFPPWGVLDQIGLDRITRVVWGACFLGFAFCAALVAAYLIGGNTPAYRAWLISACRLVAVAAMFIVTFALTSPWSIYQLQFVPDIVMQSIRTGLGDKFGLLWLPFIFGSLNYDGDLVGWETGALSMVGAALLLRASLRRDYSGSNRPFFFVLGYLMIFLVFLVVHVNRVTVQYALPVIPCIVLLAAFGLSGSRALATRWLGERAGTAAVVALAMLIAGLQIWHGVNNLLAYRKVDLIEALTPENKSLGDWLLGCVSADAKVFAAPGSYVPPQFRFVVAESHRQLVDFDPDVVVFAEGDMIAFRQSADQLAADPYTGDIGDIDSFFDEITQSVRWQRGPTFVRFQVYLPSARRVAIHPNCQ